MKLMGKIYRTPPTIAAKILYPIKMKGNIAGGTCPVFPNTTRKIPVKQPHIIHMSNQFLKILNDNIYKTFFKANPRSLAKTADKTMSYL